MKQDILFLHCGFPGQFYYWAAELAKRGHRVVFLSSRKGGSIPGVQCFSYVERELPSGGNRLLAQTSFQVEAGCEVWRCLLQLKNQGLQPQTVITHVDFGVGLFVKQIFPKCRLIAYCEWYFHWQDNEWDFEPNDAKHMRPEQHMQLQLRNSNILLTMQQADVLISPTAWQKSRFPIEYQQRIAVIPDGIDTEFYRPPQQRQQKVPLITYVSRTMEPFRGFDKVMEALSMLMQQNQNCHVLLVGQTERHEYSSKPPENRTYKEIFLDRFPLDAARSQFAGWLPETKLLEVLQASSVHVYLTRPFVLSWSFLQAMATGCAIVASHTAPILEVVTPGAVDKGIVELVDYFSPAELAKSINGLLGEHEKSSVMGMKARQRIEERYSLQQWLPIHCQLVENGRIM